MKFRNGSNYFQDSSATIMEGIIDLHDCIFFYAIGSILFVLFLLSFFAYSVAFKFDYKIENSLQEESVQYAYLLNNINTIMHITIAEILWTSVPFFILFTIIAPLCAVVHTSLNVTDYYTALIMRMAGHQVYSSYEYVPLTPSFYSTNEERSFFQLIWREVDRNKFPVSRDYFLSELAKYNFYSRRVCNGDIISISFRLSSFMTREHFGTPPPFVDFRKGGYTAKQLLDHINYIAFKWRWVEQSGEFGRIEICREYHPGLYSPSLDLVKYVRFAVRKNSFPVEELPVEFLIFKIIEDYYNFGYWCRDLMFNPILVTDYDQWKEFLKKFENNCDDLCKERLNSDPIFFTEKDEWKEFLKTFDKNNSNKNKNNLGIILKE